MRLSASRISRNGWRPWHLGLAVLLMSLAVLATWPAWLDLMYRAWRDEESSHILLTPIIVAWLVWTRASRLQRLRPRAQWLGTLCVAAGWTLYALGDVYLFETGWYCGAVLLVVGALLSVGGGNLLVSFGPAFLALVFLIPIPGTLRPYIAGPMQTATAVVVEWLFMLLGFTVNRSGNLLFVNGEAIAIAEACNGLRMVFALILVTYGFAFSAPLKTYVRLLLLVASPILAIACNVIRLIPTLWAYGYMSRDIADTFHTAAGWLMLFVALVLLIALLRLLEWMELPVTNLGRVGRQAGKR